MEACRNGALEGQLPPAIRLEFIQAFDPHASPTRTRTCAPAVALLEAGLAKLHPSFDPYNTPGGSELEQAQAKARKQKLKVRRGGTSSRSGWWTLEEECGQGACWPCGPARPMVPQAQPRALCLTSSAACLPPHLPAGVGEGRARGGRGGRGGGGGRRCQRRARHPRAHGGGGVGCHRRQRHLRAGGCDVCMCWRWRVCGGACVVSAPVRQLMGPDKRAGCVHAESLTALLPTPCASSPADGRRAARDVGGGAAGGAVHGRHPHPRGELPCGWWLACAAALRAPQPRACTVSFGCAGRHYDACFPPHTPHTKQAPLKAGDKCLAQSASDKQWYRASVEKAYAADPVRAGGAGSAGVRRAWLRGGLEAGTGSLPQPRPWATPAHPHLIHSMPSTAPHPRCLPADRPQVRRPLHRLWQQGARGRRAGALCSIPIFVSYPAITPPLVGW